MKKLFFVSLLAMLSLCANAYDFEVDGIYYNIKGSNTVEVVNNGRESYAGNIVIPDNVIYGSKKYSVTSIGNKTFLDCWHLTSINIPKGVTSIGNAAFCGCSGLTSIVVADGNSVYDSRNDCNAIIRTSDNCLVQGCQNTVIPVNVTSIGEDAFYGCGGLTSINIPKSVKSIGESAFYDCGGLTSLNIHEGVTSIGKYAFWYCSGLTSINIPESVTSIGNEAFRGCRGLTSLNISEGVTNIGNEAFYGCNGLTSIVVASGNRAYDSRNDCNAIIRTSDNCLIQGCKNTIIPVNVTSIKDFAFFDCRGLTSIDIPEGVTSIGDYAFSDCSGLTSINIPKSVTSIGESAFFGCSGLTSINIPEGVTSIGKYAFSGCSGLTSINIPEGVTSIGKSAFDCCRSLISINIPEGVTSIGDGAFNGCSGLTSINIPESVTSIGAYAFGYCGSLADIYCYAATPADILYSNTFSQETYKNCTLHVPYGTTDAYKAANGWNGFFHIVEFDPTGVEAVSAGGKPAAGQRIYNLGGVWMTTPQRGLNIINGKKYLNAF